ncbi:MAG: T9SS type A sorting domain-containing protein [Flavobacteriales bacterium]
MFKKVIFLVFLVSLFSKVLVAQDYFERNINIQAFDKSNNQYIHPWVGGFNHIQVSEIDLNLDGKNDLLTFDKAGNKISTFINQGIPSIIAYTFAPQYKDSLPKLHDWVLFRDYNFDGKMDIFTYSTGGAAVYKNTSTSSLSFQLVTNLVYSDYLPDDTTNNPINLYISSTDIPAIDDIDGDGDLDILTFSILGTYVEYHKNLSKEKFGTADSLVFELSNKCWGFFAENLSNNSVTLDDTCDFNISNPQRLSIINNLLEQESYAGKKHSGSTLLTLDLDNNNSKELILGDVSFNNLTALYNADNTPNLTASYMSFEDQNFPSNNSSTLAVNMDIFPAGYYLDVNNDNVKDLLVANNCYSGCENSKSLWLYLNNGTNSLPDFVFQKTNFLQEDMIELGEGAHPIFFDYDADGLQDIVVGNYGKYDKSVPSLYTSFLSVYKNIGTVTSPVFKLIEEDLAGISTLNLDLVSNKPVLGIYPTFGDLDNDGDKDMIIGDYFGNLHYFINTAGAGNTANFVLSQPKYQSIDVGNFAAPQLVDLNRDGKLDMVIGKENGYFTYYQNSGTLSAPSFTKVTDSLGYVSTLHPNFFKGNSVPCIVDVAGSYSMFAGSASGNIFKFGNIDGNLAGTFSRLDTNFLKINEGTNSSITISGINNDLFLDMLIGNQAGGIAFFEGKQPIISVEELIEFSTINLYPNPTKDKFYIDLGSNSLNNASLELFDLLGKSILKKKVNQPLENINTTAVPQGIYLVKFSNNKGSKVFKLIKN